MLDKWKSLPKIKKFNIIFLIVSMITGIIVWKKHKEGAFRDKKWIPFVAIAVAVVTYIVGKKKLTE